MAGDWSSWLRSLYEREYPVMIRVAYHLTASRELAQDLVHDAFVLALFHREELARHPCPEAWLLRTLHNLAGNARRARARESLPLEAAADVPARAAETSLEALLPLRLSKEERTLLIWRFQYQLDYREMAARLGISEAACRKRLSRAVNRCRALLRED